MMNRREIRVPVLAILATVFLYGSSVVAFAGVPSSPGYGWMLIDRRAQEYLLSGHSAIEAVGSGVVEISGTTLATQIVDTIAVTLYLQEYDAATGAWKDVDAWPFSEASSASIESSVVVPVRSGRTYRVRARHEVCNEEVYEFGWSVTSGIVAP